MTWTGPRPRESFTAIAWVAATIAVLVGVHALENPGGGDGDGDGMTTTSTTTTGSSITGAPTITQVLPASGGVDGGTEVTIRGEDFHPDAAVWFGDDEATVLSVLPTELIAVAPAHAVEESVTVRVENPDGSDERERAFSYVVYGGTGTTSTSATTTTSSSSTTTTSTTPTTTSTTTSSTSTSTTSPTGPEFQIVWPFGEAHHPATSTFTQLGLWPEGGTPPSFDGLTWKSEVTDARIGFWQEQLTEEEQSLGTMRVLRDDFSSEPAFSGPNYLCALARIYLFDDDGFLRFTSASSQHYQHLPWIADPLNRLEYQPYYLGNQNSSPNPECSRPEEEPGGDAFAFIKGEVRELLEGLRTGESRTKEIACNESFFVLAACDTWNTSRLYATAVVDDVLPAAV